MCIRKVRTDRGGCIFTTGLIETDLNANSDSLQWNVNLL